MSVWTTWLLDSIKGRLLHYSVAIRLLRIRVAELALSIGQIAEAFYDQPRPAPTGLQELDADCADLIWCFAPSGVQLWPAVPSSAYAAMLTGAKETPFCALNWDASLSGWAALLRWWDGLCPLQEKLCLGTWRAGWDLEEQLHGEALGGALGFQNAFQLSVS